MGIKHYMEKIIKKNSQEDMEELGELFEEMYEEIPEDFAEEVKMRMYEMACGKVLTEEMAHTWVTNMQPYGEHWNKHTTDSVMEDRNIKVDPVEFYTVLNMMYNDYYKALDEDTETYIRLAVDWLKDEDAAKNKLYNYWKYVAN